jgi:hypothetical protein
VQAILVMKQLLKERDVAEMLSEENVTLFVFVNWSEYARRGSEVFKSVEAKLAAGPLNRPISWWIFDLSSSCSPAALLMHRWLMSQEQRAKIHMFPNIATGNGPVLWIKNGEIVGFEANAQYSGQDVIMHRAEEVFG